MDGSNLEHSDSDSGESWTLLEPSPSYADDAPDFTENNPTFEQVKTATNVEKDEDTDGISVISDSDPESSLPCDISYVPEELTRPTVINSQYIPLNAPPNNNNNQHNASLRNEEDFLGDNTGKHKIYVHRRNKRLSTVLNIIMLGSVITAAGVAIGHMWGAKNECVMHTTPSVNKILSNLYKLQEENAYLRSKLKELTLASSIHMQQKKMSLEKIPFKQRCKKVYEEPLNSKNVNKITKCIEMDDTNAEKRLFKNQIQPDIGKEFISDVDKLKNIYLQNKSWLDDEVARRIKNEEQNLKNMVKNMKTPLTSITEEQKGVFDDNVKEQSEDNQLWRTENDVDLLTISGLNSINSNILNDSPPTERKITYADSLKSDQQSHQIKKRDINIANEKEKSKEHVLKKKVKIDKDAVYDILSEEDLKKDDRYVGPKMKLDKKKRDRQKLHKKQKRRNKYEQWEMKGGYLKDFDEFSLTSSQENEFILQKPDQNHFKQDFKEINDPNKLDNDEDNSKEKPSKGAGKKGKNEDVSWYDKRAALRTEARKRLEHELFGETSPNNSGWYFRRVQKREQCRAKGDNSTYKKLFKRNMNYKMKK